MTFTACGRTIPAPEAADRLSAAWANPEDYRSRMLVTFDSEAAAREYAAAVTGLYQACPEETPADGYTTLADVVGTDLSADSSVVLLHYELDERPAVGLGLVQVIRVGRAILLETGSNEGGAGRFPEAERRSYLDTNAGDLRGVVSGLSTL